MAEYDFYNPKRPKCKDCENNKCANAGKYIRQEAPCKGYKPVDPMLRKPTYNRDAPRIRIKKTIKISPENNLFLCDHIMKIDKKIDGRKTRCVNFCLDKIRGAVDGGLVEIPSVPSYMVRGELVQLSQTFTPDLWEWIEVIFNHYDGKRSLSWIVDYMIEMIRVQVTGE